jgi:DNA gyrase subunit A
MKPYQIPVASRQARGRPLVNLLPLDEGERISSFLVVDEYHADQFIFFATQNGTVKKTPLPDFSRQRSVGLRAINLDEGDELVGTAITTGDNDIMLVSSSGKVNRFKESDVRSMGRTSRGVRGIKMAEGFSCIALIIPEADGKVLTVSQHGYGKRTEVEDFPTKGRATQGVIGMQCSDRNGSLVGATQVFDGDEIMMISNQGTLVRTRTDEISILGRNTQGVRLIKVAEDESLIGVERIAESDASDEGFDDQAADAEMAEAATDSDPSTDADNDTGAAE